MFLGVISSIASDAGYLVLIPLGAAAFKSVGRHPLAGMAAAFAGVAGGFGVNLLVTPTDAVLTEITNEAIHLVDPARLDRHHGQPLVRHRLDHRHHHAAGHRLARASWSRVSARTTRRWRRRGEELPTSRRVRGRHAGADSKGLRWAGIGLLVALGVVLALTLPPGAPLRDPETGSIIGTSPFMDSLIVIISLLFLAAGLGYGRGAGTLKTSNDVIDAITKSWAGMAGLLFLFLLIAQFIAYFNYSQHRADRGGQAGRPDRADRASATCGCCSAAWP